MGALKKEEEERLFQELQKKEVIERFASFSWDGKNLVIRFPKEIADTLGVNKENRKEKKLRLLVKIDNDKIETEFSVVEKENGKKNKIKDR